MDPPEGGWRAHRHQRWKKTRELVWSELCPSQAIKDGRVAVEAKNYYDFVSGSCVS